MPLLGWLVPPYRAVIFDMDGLLIDTEPIWRRAEREIFGQLGLELSDEDLMQTMGVRVREVVALWHSRHPWDGPSIDDVTQRIVGSVIDHVGKEGEPLPGVRQAIETAYGRGLRIGIASSSSVALIEEVVERLGIRDDLSVICSGDDEPAGKPDPAVYLTAARLLGVPPDACLAFEDSPNGVLAARAAGMFCIAVPDRHLAGDPRMAQAQMTLPSLEAFTPPLLEKLQARGSQP